MNSIGTGRSWITLCCGLTLVLVSALFFLWVAALAWTTADDVELEVRERYEKNANHRANRDHANRGLPNIVMIVLDDLGSHDLGLHGTGIHTPNIDGFVHGPKADGIYLDEYYVLPYCSPTRAALLSGMYPLRTGVHNVIVPISTAGLPLNIETLPEMLKRANIKTNANERSNGKSTEVQQEQTYQTHGVGKWHIGHSSWEQTPTFRGFDSFFGFYQGGQDYFTHMLPEGGVDLHYDRSPRCGKGCSEVVNEKGNYSTHVFTREAIKVVKNHSKNFGSESKITAPLFLYLAYQAVHCPNEVPSEYMTRYQNRTDWTEQRINYAGMLTAADEGIGNLTKVLRETGLWENTLIVVTTDNGGPTTVGCTQGSSNYPKRGGKCSLWEGGTTGDALLAGPALKKLLSKKNRPSSTPWQANAPRRFQHLFHAVDWFPTLAEWVGVVPLNQTALDGISQAENLSSGQEPARTELFGGYAFWRDSEYPNENHWWWGPSIRHLNWKLVQGTSGGPDASDPMPNGTRNILPPGASADYLLFDLDRDPREENDLSKAHPEILEKMIYKLKLYQKSFVNPQVNDDSLCPFPGLVNTSIVGPAW